jgi:hypothetical protein
MKGATYCIDLRPDNAAQYWGEDIAGGWNTPSLV